MIDRPRLRGAPTWPLLAVLCAAAACATSSSTDQAPTGPKPTVTVLLRVRSPQGPQVQLVAKGVEQSVLETATSSVATSVFPDAEPGPPQATDTTVQHAVASAAPITLPDAAMSLTITSQQIDAALSAIHPVPTSVAVWACTDDRRPVQVTTQAPGAVSSDATSSGCSIVGTSLEDDGASWTSTIAIGELQPPSLLPVAIVTSVVLVLVALAIAFLRGRAAAREAAAGAAPSEPPVD